MRPKTWTRCGSYFYSAFNDSTFDEVLATWRDSIHSEQFFGEMLSPIINAERVDEEMVELILEAGYNFNEEQFEAAREGVDSQEELLRRIKEEAAPSVFVADDAPPLEQTPSRGRVLSNEPAPRKSGEEAVPQEILSEAGLTQQRVEVVRGGDPASRDGRWSEGERPLRNPPPQKPRKWR